MILLGVACFKNKKCIYSIQKSITQIKNIIFLFQKLISIRFLKIISVQNTCTYKFLTFDILLYMKPEPKVNCMIVRIGSN